MPASAFDRIQAAQRIANAALLPRNLMGGVESMRLASLGNSLIQSSVAGGGAQSWSYLPKWPLETVDAWQSRVNSTFLEPYYSGAWQALIGKAFSEGVTLGDDVAPEIAELWENVDYAGTHGEVFAQWVFGDSLHTGLGHILVEYPKAEGLVTVADERAAGVRPYWVYVPGDAVLGWRFETVNGQQRLTQFRYEENTVEPDGAFGEKPVKRARVYYASDAENPYARWEVYREGGQNAQEALESAGTLYPHTEIPLATFCPQGVRWEAARPFLHDLAWVNLEAWQSGSDQRNILHFARVPFYGFFGFTEAELKAFTGVGASARAHSENVSAHIDVIEGSGVGMGEGWKDLDRLRNAAESLSIKPFEPSIVPQTATGVLREQGAAMSPLEFALRNFQDTIERALGFTALWLGFNVEAGGSVTMAQELSGTQAEGEKAQTILEAQKNGLISKKTTRLELQALGVFSDQFDPEEEEELLALEGASGGKFDANAEGDFMAEPDDDEPTSDANPVPEDEEPEEEQPAEKKAA